MYYYRNKLPMPRYLNNPVESFFNLFKNAYCVYTTNNRIDIELQLRDIKSRIKQQEVDACYNELLKQSIATVFDQYKEVDNRALLVHLILTGIDTRVHNLQMINKKINLREPSSKYFGFKYQWKNKPGISIEVDNRHTEKLIYRPYKLAKRYEYVIRRHHRRLYRKHKRYINGFFKKEVQREMNRRLNQYFLMKRYNVITASQYNYSYALGELCRKQKKSKEFLPEPIDRMEVLENDKRISGTIYYAFYYLFFF